MLVKPKNSPTTKRAASDDRGAVLITVVLVMLVGFVVAATIAASVLFTIQANDANEDRTEAFIAAESGRDAQLAKLLGACTSGTLTATNTDETKPPRYSAFADKCFDGYVNSTVTIDSTGTAPDGSTATITTQYSRTVTYTNQPGGTMSYFAGKYLLTKSTYAGDLVIRDSPTSDGNYRCNSDSTITGDLWIPVGFASLSSKCAVTGTVYARDYVNAANGSEAVIGGDIVAGGNVTMTSNKTKVAGNLYSNGNVEIDKSTVAKQVIATGTVTVNGTTFTKTRPGGTAQADGSVVFPGVGPVTGTITVGKANAATFNPSLQSVYDMTTWVDLPLARGAWGADGTGGSNVAWSAGPCDGSSVSSLLTATLPAGMTRSGIDYTSCTGPVTIKISGSSLSLTRDVVFLVAAGSNMTIDVAATLNSTAPVASQPQLFFIRGDANLTNSKPDCATSSASDSLDLPAIAKARVMLYTPCGLKRSNQNGLVFNGQFYSNSDGDTHLVHPEFTCQPMTWVPILDMGCKIASATPGSGSAVATPQVPVLIRQSE